ncbi:anti-sigma factor [Hansschlegelia sp. KR7-227]|uniref:anti-sigma factor n=1 Tax=Hansschlegelia sp. KR7-227 TaxID=3400914 RepID=UPI003C1080D7
MTARNPQIDLYAMLTVLGHAEEADRPVASDAEIADAVAHWELELEPMTTAAAPVAAPPELWARIAASVERAPARSTVRPAPKATGGLLASLGFWRFATAAAVAAALALAVVSVRAPTPTGAAAFVAVLQAPEGDRRPGFLVEVAADRTMRLVPLGTTAAGEGRALEFWTLADKAKGPKSLGLVPGDRPTTIKADALPSIAEGQLFEVTLEPYGGSPIGKPTGPILFKGLAARTS